MKVFPSVSVLLLLGTNFIGCNAEKKVVPVHEVPDELEVVLALSSISGTVTYTGKNPKHIERDDAGRRRELLFVDSKSDGLANTIVYLIPHGAPTPMSDQALEAKVITQEDFRFLPSVIGIRAGQNIEFTNEDPENHNVRADSENSKNEFNVMVTQEYGHDKTFNAQAENKPVRLSCDIHRWMDGWIYVFDHAYFAVTDNFGAFEISDVPPGEYELLVEQPDTELRARMTVNIMSEEACVVDCAFEQIHLYSKAHPELVVTTP